MAGVGEGGQGGGGGDLSVVGWGRRRWWRGRRYLGEKEREMPEDDGFWTTVPCEVVGERDQKSNKGGS